MQKARWDAAAAPHPLTWRQRLGNEKPPLPHPPPQPQGPARGHGPRRRAERQRDHGGGSEASGRPLLSPPRLPQGRRGSRTKLFASRARPGPGVARSEATPPLHPPQKALRECPVASARTNRRPSRPASSWAACGSGPGMLETSSAAAAPPPQPSREGPSRPRGGRGHPAHSPAGQSSPTRLCSPELRMRRYPLSGPRRGPTPPPRPS